MADRAPTQVCLPDPHFRNPSGALLSLSAARVLAMAVKHNTLVVEDDPYGDLYFATPRHCSCWRAERRCLAAVN
jgi:DNA-binding transcriptional MocR family regulator